MAVLNIVQPTLVMNFIMGAVVTPIAGSTLLITIFHYHSLHQWRLFLILTIILWCNLGVIAQEIQNNMNWGIKVTSKSTG